MTQEELLGPGSAGGVWKVSYERLVLRMFFASFEYPGFLSGLIIVSDSKYVLFVYLNNNRAEQILRSRLRFPIFLRRLIRLVPGH